MKDKYWQWLKENEKAVFRSMSNTIEWLDVKLSRFHEHLMSRYIFSKCLEPSDFHKHNYERRKQDVITKSSAVAVHLKALTRSVTVFRH